MRFEQCNLSEIKCFIITNHYSRKVAPTSYAYRCYDDSDQLIGAITFGYSASPYVAISIRGHDGPIVLELTRLAINSSLPNIASRLISFGLRSLPKNILVVSYADCGVGHVGYVYQATNWYYAGKSKARTDIFSASGHARHHCGDPTRRQPRSAKHRYWIATGRKALKASKWPKLPYPKGATSRHVPGYTVK
jgi:hypothetical protein